jgi:uncharacterized protein (DUF4415 family)
MKARNAEHIVRHLAALPDGTHILEHPDGTLERRASRTDWARVDALTDEEIAEAVRGDPDAVPLDFDWSEAVLVVPPKKKAISIRLDEDVLDFFKDGGVGYQRRMNAVLRSYMLDRRKKRA